MRLHLPLELLQERVASLAGDFEANLQGAVGLTPLHRQKLVGLDTPDGHVNIPIGLVLPVCIGSRLLPRAQRCMRLQHVTCALLDVVALRVLLGQDVASPGQGLPHAHYAFGLVDGACGDGFGSGPRGFAPHLLDQFGQGAQAALPRQLRARLLLRLEGRPEVFDLLEHRSLQQRGAERVRERLPPVQRKRDSYAPSLQRVHALQPTLHSPQLVFVQRAGELLAVPRDEGDCVALFQQLYGGCHAAPLKRDGPGDARGLVLGNGGAPAQKRLGLGGGIFGQCLLHISLSALCTAPGCTRSLGRGNRIHVLALRLPLPVWRGHGAHRGRAQPEVA
mmetsp:Transcript_93007/g.266665  ORF Transcript_93007/g.266665 Transcript_93007/m.266665 type:complete len:334 (+) Transcript_93007:1521-2522(+)